jgi:acetoin utilization protein AcuC
MAGPGACARLWRVAEEESWAQRSRWYWGSAWRVTAWRFEPEFLLLQCGADSLEGDPITHLRLSAASHGRAARELCELAERLGHGRVLALGGGGYNRSNLARAWSAVVENLL